ncbi:hypothetical protein KY289_013994 [Solanum tuberosum]|nr:hypothetical protein KY289_013994 [Solanum tuberosum]
MEALKNLQQTSSVREYQAEFDRLLTRLNLSNENAISCFLGGLKRELNKSIRIHFPKTLLPAYKVARLQEEVFEAQVQSWGIKSFRKVQGPILPTPAYIKPQYSQRNSYSNSTFTKTLESAPNRINRLPNNGVTKMLSAAEMDERRSKGLCFFCDEKYVKGHNCRGKKQLYLVEVVEEEELNVEVEEEHIEDVWEKTDEFMAISLQLL